MNYPMGRDDMQPVPHQTGPGTSERLTLGFIPLVDCAPLVVAAEKGFAAAEGLDLTLVREHSWANIRDRVMLGHFDAAHMLGPMPIASTLGIGGHLEVPVMAPFSLGLGGNAITVSEPLFAAMERHGAILGEGPARTGEALRRAIAARRASGEPPLTLAMVYPFSGHNYELRYWLASAGLDPDRDLRLTVLPPPFMVDALTARHIDGFCVGEPWNSIAVERGVGVIVTTKSALWRQGPEKVLGVRQAFADEHPARLAALIRALYRAAAWAGDPGNRAELATLLAAPGYVGVPAAIILRALKGELQLRAGQPRIGIPDFLVFHAHAANFPWQSHSLWFYSQMVRWGQTGFSPEQAEKARRVYRPDLYRAALLATDADLPSANAKVEGALKEPTPVASRNGRMVLGADGFFDSVLFDPDDIEGYLRRFQMAI
jgi:ABC-type nitrate/sulfonate/bicarbonate transport system substrate-binding protein